MGALDGGGRGLARFARGPPVAQHGAGGYPVGVARVGGLEAWRHGAGCIGGLEVAGSGMDPQSLRRRVQSGLQVAGTSNSRIQAWSAPKGGQAQAGASSWCHRSGVVPPPHEGNGKEPLHQRKCNEELEEPVSTTALALP